MKTRVNNLINHMPQDFEAALVKTEENRFYVLDFDTGDAGTVLILKDKTYFIIDSRYIEICSNEIKTAEIILEDKALEQVHRLLQENGIKKLYMENKISVAFADKVKAEMQDVELDLTSTLSDTLDVCRMVKDAAEIANIRAAQKITDMGFTHMLKTIKPGMSEIELARELDFFMLTHGATKLAFDTILVSGPNTSLPHGVPGERKIQAGDFVTMDFGANVNGYCSDMTRTIAVGHATEEMKQVYGTVLKAQLAVAKSVKGGMKGNEVDKIARDIIYEAGYEGHFGHGLGHSLGIEIHEDPRFSPMCEKIIPAGTVMTNEPGIYLAGKFGVRIEDTLALTESGCEIFATSDKNLIILDV
ncbi:MAG: aminopeptidase P family protein [Oscillospiraceae bacterium]|nr:aminopeptidase P family protein [Oscillospiraceae bacterium]